MFCYEAERLLSPCVFGQTRRAEGRTLPPSNKIGDNVMKVRIFSHRLVDSVNGEVMKDLTAKHHDVESIQNSLHHKTTCVIISRHP